MDDLSLKKTDQAKVSDMNLKESTSAITTAKRPTLKTVSVRLGKRFTYPLTAQHLSNLSHTYVNH